MDINDYIKNNLRPTENEINVVQSIINSITTILQKDNNLSVAKCLPGGSFAKGTMLRSNFEGDVVYIINKNYNFDELLEYVKKLLKGNFQQSQVEIKYKAVNIKVQKPIEIVEIDVLPAFEINSPIQMSQVVNKQYYAGSSNKFQVEYIIEQKKIDSSFGDVIRMLKHWKKIYNVPLSGFQLELLAANGINGNYIEKWGECLIACFNAILKMTSGKIIYPINWKYFKNEVVPKESNNGVLLVDPGNPMNNVAGNLSSNDLDRITDITKKSIEIINNKGINYLIKNE